MSKSSPRITALRELSAEAELERRDFLYEATEQLRRFLEQNRERLREIGPIKLVDDAQDYLLYHPVDETWTTRLTYQDPADNEWYDQEQLIDTISELVELYNPADIFSWLMEAARDAPSHLVAADELARQEELVEAGADDWQADLPPTQQETLAAQRLCANPAFIETGVQEMTPAAPQSVSAPRQLTVNGNRVFWVYFTVHLATGQFAIGRANLDGRGAEYPIMSGTPYLHGDTYGSLGADDSRVFFIFTSWSPDSFDGEINSFDANFAAGSATGCCSPSWPSIGDPFSADTLSGGVAVDSGHVYWAHVADRELHCFLDDERSTQRRRGRRIRFKVWLGDCERISVRASGKVGIARKRYKLKPKAAVVGPSFAPSDLARLALRPRRRDRHEIRAALNAHPAYARIRLRIADASGNSRVTTYRVRLARRRGHRGSSHGSNRYSMLSAEASSSSWRSVSPASAGVM